MAEVTEADREKAARLIAQRWAADGPDSEVDGMALLADIAAALAEEREKARAPFAELAQELARVATYHHETVAGDAYADSADRIIAVLEGTYR
jgi:protein involved in temperature-dependent protein secretion